MDENAINKDMVKNNDLVLCVAKRGQTLHIPIVEIIYIESRAHKLYIHTKYDSYEYYDKMNNVEQLLDGKGFVRCHQSYMVNINEVSVTKRDVLVVLDREIKISRKYKEKVRKVFGNNNVSSVSEKVYILDNDEQSTGDILCINGPYAGNRYGLVPEREIVIGRDGNVCDIVINTPKVSRKHLCITYHRDRNCYEIMDLSTNGTYINGDIRIEKNMHYEIGCGETLELGDRTTVLKLL